MASGRILASVLVLFLLHGEAGAAPESSALQIAQSDALARGEVDSRSYHPVPEGLAFDVLPYDDTDLNLSIKQRFVTELTEGERGFADGAPLQLLFESGMLQGSIAESGPSLGSFKVKDGGVRAEINIWSSSKDSLMGGRQTGDGSRSASVFHINVTLRDLRDGRTLWQGDAYCEAAVGREARIAESMVGPLIQALGTTVQNEPFVVY